MIDVPDHVKESARRSIKIDWSTVGPGDNNIEIGAIYECSK